jgi:hypothetical protein
MTPHEGFLRQVLARVRRFLATVDAAHRGQVTALTAFELRELENLFVLLLLGSFVGLPFPPSFLAAELLPHLEHEIKVLQNRARDASDALAELSGVLGID